MSFETKPTYQEAVTEDKDNKYFLTAEGALIQTQEAIREKQEKLVADTYAWVQTTLENLIVEAIKEGKKQIQFTPPNIVDINTLQQILREAGYKISTPFQGAWTISWDLEIT